MARRKSKKEKMKKARIESLVDNERWEAAIRERAIGASTSRPIETDRPAIPEQRDAPDGDAAGVRILLLVINIGDSRVVLATKGEDDSLTAVKLKVDLKPNLPAFAIFGIADDVDCFKDSWLMFGTMDVLDIIMCLDVARYVCVSRRASKMIGASSSIGARLSEEGDATELRKV
ncbi:hypothetical protein T459_14723 [Capsicum annuum]|uniref:PPM-type phosphatase domain-containing protein n=1 Tax=Capsicum annuum TaxID=4072 RepID=A0A2G2ZI83_CAPAN|nr:hypothetical protein T459_14723 [Capsicum annuum]